MFLSCLLSQIHRNGSCSHVTSCSLRLFLSVKSRLKFPLLWVMEGSYFVMAVPNNTLTCMQGKKKKTLSLSYMHLFLPYLLNDSQTIRSTVNFSKPLLWVMLICGDWSHFHFILPVNPDKTVFVSAVLLSVQHYWGNNYFTAPKAAPRWFLVVNFCPLRSYQTSSRLFLMSLWGCSY